MKRRIFPSALASAMCIGLWSSLALAQSPHGRVSRTCSAEKANAVLGKRYTPGIAERARRLAGARDIRRIGPDGVATMDYSAYRLNIHLGADGRIRELRCG